MPRAGFEHTNPDFGRPQTERRWPKKYVFILEAANRYGRYINKYASVVVIYLMLLSVARTTVSDDKMINGNCVE